MTVPYRTGYTDSSSATDATNTVTSDLSAMPKSDADTVLKRITPRNVWRKTPIRNLHLNACYARIERARKSRPIFYYESDAYGTPVNTPRAPILSDKRRDAVDLTTTPTPSLPPSQAHQYDLRRNTQPSARCAEDERQIAQRRRRTRSPQKNSPRDRSRSPRVRQGRPALTERSTIIVQMRTGKIGLRHHLYQRGVPDIPNRDCQCGRATQTVRHILLACPLFNDLREETLGRRSGGLGGEGSVKTILNTLKLAIQAAKFMLKTGLLGQFGAVCREEIDQAEH
ncbi:hypothetical protein PHISCL_09164 [Aspergillus sclerotialis]|uniref:Reverse transcriptase n=1 Tax=Aspergillus sclerotialis TaxID=2070753 RepID=A0A3A2Z5W7_9EURO|nr:hypothetical protein PHISCL_09164 [Aspergillus sclerotialis]